MVYLNIPPLLQFNDKVKNQSSAASGAVQLIPSCLPPFISSNGAPKEGMGMSKVLTLGPGPNSGLILRLAYPPFADASLTDLHCSLKIKAGKG